MGSLDPRYCRASRTVGGKIPDGLAIRRCRTRCRSSVARGVPAAILAFGHGHLGLTLASVTADLVAAEVAGHGGAAALAAFSPRRFSR
jgi:glycine/D-amino acid oxidase-like deaminating enzyme